ncbi:unnamed protein product [Spirodela intermedia]|uniref:Uncharacterized protein n=1 Tax=Spirodela intermedia TaxID=51605 RepID=A0A7I8IMR8_SPIIN|nr:unnamed protein product [Spirodela intermedia]CAA6658750.1 unnamed protein product [Spirodela intermedia]
MFDQRPAGGGGVVGDERAPSLVVTLKERDWPLRKLLLCQFCPQFLVIACQPPLEPLMETAWTSPEWPLMVNLILPFSGKRLCNNSTRGKDPRGGGRLPPVGDGNDAGAVLGNVLEDGLGEQAPQLSPLLNSAVLSAAVSVPYPWLRLRHTHCAGGVAAAIEGGVRVGPPSPISIPAGKRRH